GKLLASGGEDGRVRLWNVTTGKELDHLGGEQRGDLSVCLSPDGKTVASRGGDARIRLWETATGKALGDFEREGMWSYLGDTFLALTPDGKTLASTCQTDVILLWDVSTGKFLRFCRSEYGRPRCLVFSPDGKKLAVAVGGRSCKVHLWDV